MKLIDNTLRKQIEEIAIKVYKGLMKSGSFTNRLLSDTPTDDLQVANKKYVDDTGGGRAFQAILFDFTTSVSTGNGKMYIHIDSRVGGMTLVDVEAFVITAGTTGTLDIQIANVTQAVDMLTTKLTIDSGETDSITANIPAVIDTPNATVTLNDILRIDIDAVQTTAPKGLVVTLGFN